MTIVSTIKESSDGLLLASQGKYRIRIIEGNKLGSSGYWPREVIERDGPKVFGINTHVNLDHMGFEESWDRPEGSVRNLAGFISSVPEYEEANDSNENVEGLYADVTFLSEHADFISEIKHLVGMSVTAWAISEAGVVDNQEVDIIARIVEGISVDVVTRAGAGGAILQAVESKKLTIPEGTKLISTKNDVAKVSQESKKGSKLMDLSDETAKELTSAVSEMNDFLKKAKEAADKKKQNAEEASNTLDPVELAGLLAEAELPKLAQSKVMESIKLGVKPEDAIKAEKDYIESITKDIKPVNESEKDPVVKVGESSGSDFDADDFDFMKELA